MINKEIDRETTEQKQVENKTKSRRRGIIDFGTTEEVLEFSSKYGSFTFQQHRIIDFGNSIEMLIFCGILVAHLAFNLYSLFTELFNNNRLHTIIDYFSSYITILIGLIIVIIPALIVYFVWSSRKRSITQMDKSIGFMTLYAKIVRVLLFVSYVGLIVLVFIQVGEYIMYVFPVFMFFIIVLAAFVYFFYRMNTLVINLFDWIHLNLKSKVSNFYGTTPLVNKLFKMLLVYLGFIVVAYGVLALILRSEFDLDYTSVYFTVGITLYLSYLLKRFNYYMIKDNPKN